MHVRLAWAMLGSMDDLTQSSEQSRALKEQLPFPYNQDLSKVLRSLNRRNAGYRSQQANDPVTASYLRAAILLVQRYLGPGKRRAAVDAGNQRSILWRLLGFLSQRAVAAAVRHNPAPFHRVGSVSTLRDRWKCQSDFYADLLRFCLWALHYPAAHQDDMIGAAGEALRGSDPVEGIHQLCYWNLNWLLSTPMFRLGLIAAATAETDPVVREAMRDRHRTNGPMWKQLYESFLEARGLRLRPGVTLDDCVTLLGAAADGLAMYGLSNPDAVVIDNDRQQSLLGTVVLALIAGCTERANQTDSESLEDAVRALITASPAEGSPSPDGTCG